MGNTEVCAALLDVESHKKSPLRLASHRRRCGSNWQTKAPWSCDHGASFKYFQL